MPHNYRLKETHEQKVIRAHKCANAVIASGHMCAGCNIDAYCRVSQMWAAKRKRKAKAWEKAYYGKAANHA